MNTAYGLYQTGKGAPKFEVFTSAEDARKHGNGFNIVKKQSCLSDARLFPTRFLVEIYNLKAERKVAKFRDRATAESRVWKMLTDQEAPVVEDFSEAEETESGAEEPKKRKARKSSSKFKGKIITTSCVENPRKKKTGYGYNSMKIVLEAGDSGILYEDYLAAGGRRNDLAWDIERGWAMLK
jgi:hypothetical protein